LDDCHVVAFHVAALSKALPKSAQTVRQCLG